MQTSGTLEETDLTEQGSGEEQTPTPQQEEHEEDTTALVPTEPEVIEGEVIEIAPPEASEDHTPPKQKPYWLLVPFTIMLCLLLLAVSLVLPQFSPSATVIIIPLSRTITTTALIRVPGRQLAPLTLSQSATVPTTGKRHQNANRAEGTITFYNGLLTGQTVAAGTILTGTDGIHVITEQPATIPAANPPLEGHATVSAHAVSAGAQGNIPAYDVNQACCATAVVARNTTAFTAGRNARAYRVVTKSDLANAQEAIQEALTKSEQAALTTQLNPGEALITLPCKPVVSSDHKPGDEEKQVTVTVSDTCVGISYAAHDVYANATQVITTDAAQRFGTGYNRIGDIQTTIMQATAPSANQGVAHIIVQITGTLAYQITPRIQEQLVWLVAGKPEQQAKATLLQIPGIAGVLIFVRGGDTTLPQDVKAIRILVRYNADHIQS